MANVKPTSHATIGDEIELLRRQYPNKNGLRIRAPGEKRNRSAREASLFVYLVSRSRANGVHYEIHRTDFGSERRARRSSDWWARYISGRILKGNGSRSGNTADRLGVLDGVIIPAVNRRTGMRWQVQCVIGYALK
jgi:hypothetical protein